MRRLVAAGVICSIVMPVLWAAMSTHTVAMGDIALIELRTRDVLSGHPPLLGAYSRYGWAHPGALAFVVLAIPYRLLGGDGDALRLAALLVNLVALIALAWVPRRRGNAAWAAVLVAIVLLVWGFTPNMLSDSWNATMVIVAFMLVIVACWCALCGDPWAWPIAAVAAAFTFQTHAGFGIVLVPVVASTLVVLVVRAPSPSSEITRRAVGAGIGWGALAALPLLIDTIVHWPGNLGTLIRWSASNGEPTVGLADSLRYIARTSSLSFVRHAEFPNQFLFTYGTIATGFLPGVLLVLLAAAGVVAVRQRMTAEAWFCGCLGVTWLGGVVACANIAAPLGYWLIEWLQPLAWLTWACVAITAWRLVRASGSWSRLSSWVSSRVWSGTGRSTGTTLRALAAAPVVVAFAIGTIVFARATVGDHRAERNNELIEALTDAAVTVGTDQPTRIEYDPLGFASSPMMFAVANQLDRRGMQLCVVPDLALYFGSARVCAGRADLHLLVRDEAVLTDPPPDAERLEMVDELTPAQRGEVEALTADLADVLERNGRGADVPLLNSELAGLAIEGQTAPELVERRHDFERLTELRRLPGGRFSVYLVYDQPPE